MRYYILKWSLVFSALFSVGSAQAAIIAYNTFLENPVRCCQEPGFGYYGGMQGTTETFGNSFTPTSSGLISDIWIGIGSSLSDVGTDTVNVFLHHSGANNAPAQQFANFTIIGELSKRESVVKIVVNSDIPLEEGTRYWMLISPGEGTFEVGWLSGPPNEIDGEFSAYPSDADPSGWFVAPFSNNGALRIDVSPIPLPAGIWFLLSGLIAVSAVQLKKIVLDKLSTIFQSVSSA